MADTHLIWDINPVAFRLPLLNIDVYWYGILFALGFFFSFLVGRRQIAKLLVARCNLDVKKAKSESHRLADMLSWFIILATVIGARIAHVLFYDFSYHLSHPWEIFNIRAGGLASHGAAVAIPIALWLFYKKSQKHYPNLLFLNWLDLISPLTLLAGFFIRVGNFSHQEIVGHPSDLPFAIVFKKPLMAVGNIARHPTQLYEAITYITLFIVLYNLYPRLRNKTGMTTGLFFFLTFGARFFLEFTKELSGSIAFFNLNSGQVLSIPFILLGLILTFRQRRVELSNVIQP